MDASMMSRLKVATENIRLKMMFAEELLKAEMRKEVMKKKW